MNWRIFYNPLSILDRKQSFIASVVTITILTVVAWWGWIYLDGALDLHVGDHPSATIIILQSIVAWLSLGVFFFAVSKAFRGNGGFLAHLSAAGLGRFPYIFASIVGAHLIPTGMAIRSLATVSNGNVTVNMDKLASPTAMAGLIILLLFTVWSIVMLYAGFKTAGHLQGSRAAFGFAIAVILAEIASKIVLALAYKAGLA